MKYIFTITIVLLICLNLFAQQSPQKSINDATRNVPAAGVVSSGQLPDMDAFTADGEAIKVRELCKGKYTVLAAGCLTCPLFHQNYPEIEAAYADYAEKGGSIFLFLQIPATSGIRRIRAGAKYIRTFTSISRSTQKIGN